MLALREFNPNPASNFVVVYNYKDEMQRTIFLYDINGKMVNQVRTYQTATRIETSGLRNGIYILRITDGSSKVIRTEKIIIQH